MIGRVLIVGHGSIGKRHLSIVRETLPEADIRVLRHQPCGTIPEDADGCFSSLPEACAFAPQVAVIASPAPFHLEAAGALITAGCHLLIEKPLSHTADGINQILRDAHDRSLTLQVGYNLRYLPSMGEFRNRIQAGMIGRVLSVRCEVGQYLPAWRPGTDYRASVSANSKLGGGVLLELSHELDFLRWIFGEVSWVAAWLGRKSALEIDVEDTAHLTIGFTPDGCAPIASLNLDFIRYDTTRQCTAIGELGSLRWNGLTGTVEEWAPGSTAWQVAYHDANQRNDSYRTQWLHFLECVQTGRPPGVSGWDGLAVLKSIEAARQSAAAQGVRVDIDNQTEEKA